LVGGGRETEKREEGEKVQKKDQIINPSSKWRSQSEVRQRAHLKSEDRVFF